MNCGTKDCELLTFSIGTKDCEFQLNSQSLIPQSFLGDCKYTDAFLLFTHLPIDQRENSLVTMIYLNTIINELFCENVSFFFFSIFFTPCIPLYGH